MSNQRDGGPDILRVVLPVGALLMTLAVLATVFVHDMRCNRDSMALCRRPDGSEWRDPSGGCTVAEDPRCSEGQACTDSLMIEESTYSCSWFL